MNRVVTTLVLFCTAAPGWAQIDLSDVGTPGKLSRPKSDPAVQPRLLASRTGIVPGEPIELAVEFDVRKDWHIYWRHSGESGFPPRLHWELPPGFEDGPLRWPTPQRYIDQADAHTFILEGRPTLLTTLKTPKSLTEKSVEIKVNADWLYCDSQQCFPGNKTLTLTLPVVSADKAEPANEEVFAAARNRISVPISEAKHVAVKAVPSVEKVVPGKEFKVGVVLDIKKGFHINSHKPSSKDFIATDVFHDTPAGVTIGRAEFPSGHKEKVRNQTLSVYRASPTLVLPVQADGEIKEKEIRFSGIVVYQACNDADGKCYPTVAVDWSLNVPVAGAGEAVRPINKPIFTGASTSGTPGPGFDLISPIKPTVQQEEHSLIGWLALALLAGLVLNITPCVLPVISIKVLSFVQQASESPRRVFQLGLAFSLGMMIVFNILAALATSAGLVWGQHFQSPQFTVAMAAVVFAFGLSLFGVYHFVVPQAVGTLAAKADQKEEGYIASIAKGGLATVMGTPCLGPFLGPVLVWATSQTPPMVFLVFNTIGVGMALPYLLLTANPKWLRFVPRPGPWLTHFKQGMAFLLMATVVYLLYIVEGQLGGQSLVWIIALLLMIALGAWILGTWITHRTPPVTRWLVRGLAAVIVLVAGGWALKQAVRVAPKDFVDPFVERRPDPRELPWVPFSLEKLTELTAAGTPVFLDITARWCPNCHWNSEWVINTAEVDEAVRKHGVVPMLADWTNREQIIGDVIETLAPGASIPLAAIFPAGRPKEPTVMLGILTQKKLIQELEKGAQPANLVSDAGLTRGE